MQPVLFSLFNHSPPPSIAQLFGEVVPTQDGPETGAFWNGEKLQYHWYDEHHGVERQISFDFRQTLSEIGKKLGPAPKELLGKALGKGDKLAIWDLTGGTGRDALSMYKWGHQIKVFERNPIIAGLLMDALNRAPELKDRFEVIFGEAMKMDHTAPPDIIFYDPMYPAELKKSRPKIDLAFFKELLDGDEDQSEVLEWALNSGAKRIILKRPIKASESLTKPTASLKGKTIRFDLWQRG